MANFSTKNWLDRVTQFPTRRKLAATETTDIYDVSREEGTVMQEGDAFNSANMNDLESRISEAFNNFFPIGSIYLSANNVNPSSFFGGTWVSWGSGRVPVGIDKNDGDFNTSEKIGGSKNLQTHSHYVNIDYSASTTHNHNGRNDIFSEGIGTNRANSYRSGTAIQTSGDGNSGNLQPYITCFMWKRTG
jgi:hypothetical protein